MIFKSESPSVLSMGFIMLVNVINNLYEEFEDTKGVIRIRKSKKDRQHNDQKKKDKMTNNDLQNIDIKPDIEQHEPLPKPG